MKTNRNKLLSLAGLDMPAQAPAAAMQPWARKVRLPDIRAGANVTVTRDAQGYVVAAAAGGGGGGGLSAAQVMRV